jgi:glycosyltransferase involved in cell wall biosynthesis
LTTNEEKTGIGKYSRNISNQIHSVNLHGVRYKGQSIDFGEDVEVVHGTGYKFPLGNITLNQVLQAPSLEIEGNYDIYHADEPKTALFPPEKENLVATVHDIRPLTHPEEFPNSYVILFERCMDLIAEEYDKVISVSQSTKEKLLAETPMISDNINVVHNGVDQSVFRQRNRGECREDLGLDRNEKLILHVGENNERKNLDAVFKVFEKCLDELENVRLIRIGNKNNSRHPYGRRSENVVYVEEWISEEDISKYYNACDVLLYPSLAEGFSLVLPEAISCGLPVVASNIQPNQEALGDSFPTYYPKDVESMTERVISLLKDEELAKNASDRMINRSKEFSWQKCAGKTEKIYNQLSK